MVAFFEIPDGSVDSSGRHFIKVWRYRRVDGDPNSFEPLEVETNESPPREVFGWGYGYPPDPVQVNYTAPDPVRIEIIDASDLPSGVTPMPTPQVGWADYSTMGVSWAEVGDDLEDLIPNPVAWVTARRFELPGPIPAAWETELTYPRSRMRITGVAPRNTTPGSAIVTWDAGGDPGATSCATPDQTLSIQVVDPTRKTRSVSVAFELLRFEDQGCGGRIELSDLDPVPGSFRAFNPNGVETSEWYLEILPGSPAFR